MSTNSTPRTARRSALLGLGAGVVGLGLVGGFGIGLPHAVTAPNDRAIHLPAEIEGWKSVAEAAKKTMTAEQAQQFAASWKFADTALAKAVDGATATQQYVFERTQTFVAVQAFRGEGGPLVPAEVEAPASESGKQPAVEVATYGDVKCIQRFVQQADPTTGQASVNFAGQSCQLSRDGLTLRSELIQSQGSLADAASLLDDLYTSIQG